MLLTYETKKKKKKKKKKSDVLRFIDIFFIFIFHFISFRL
jgi:hypothetical protein